MKLKLVLFVFVLAISSPLFAQSGFPFDNEIRAFKHQDSLSFPKPDGILFIGSSSIRMWVDLEQRFAGKPIIRRGVGGSTLAQMVNYYTPYILFPYHPSKIFIYDGENDIAEGQSADSVFHNLKIFWRMTRKQLPQAKIYFMSIKQSPVRAKYYPEVARANKMIKEYLKSKPGTLFIDLNTVLYNAATSTPDSSLFKSDYLHLNSKGYDRWEKVLRPYVN